MNSVPKINVNERADFVSIASVDLTAAFKNTQTVIF